MEIINWLETEEQNLNQPADFEKLPTLKLEPNKVTKLSIDITKQFEKWTGDQSGKTITKAIIPVIHLGERKNFWLNVRNPLYRDIIHAAREGKTDISLVQTGTQDKTRYALVE